MRNCISVYIQEIRTINIQEEHKNIQFVTSNNIQMQHNAYVSLKAKPKIILLVMFACMNDT